MPFQTYRSCSLFLVLALIRYFSSQIAAHDDQCPLSFDFTEAVTHSSKTQTNISCHSSFHCAFWRLRPGNNALKYDLYLQSYSQIIIHEGVYLTSVTLKINSSFKTSSSIRTEPQSSFLNEDSSPLLQIVE